MTAYMRAFKITGTMFPASKTVATSILALKFGPIRNIPQVAYCSTFVTDFVAIYGENNLETIPCHDLNKCIKLQIC